MWKSISRLVTLVFTFSDKFAQHDKQIEGLERKYNDLLKQVQQLALASERQAERELWREQVFRQALEIERLKLENERLREQKALPPSSQSTESKEN